MEGGRERGEGRRKEIHTDRQSEFRNLRKLRFQFSLKAFCSLPASLLLALAGLLCFSMMFYKKAEKNSHNSFSGRNPCSW